MQPAVVRYVEPLTNDERSFLTRKEVKERKQFYGGARVIMGICFAVPFAFAWVKALDGSSNPFSPAKYFAGVIFLLGLSGVSGYISYYRTLRKVQIDLRKGVKAVESASVTRKVFMPHDSSFHLYLNSTAHLSIEVSEVDYRRLEEGDEVNIEYTPSAKVYLGYY